MQKLIFIIAFMELSGCARAPIENSKNAMKLVEEKISIVDELPSKQLLQGIKEVADVLKRKKNKSMTFGPVSITTQQYSTALDNLMACEKKNPGSLSKLIEKNFYQYEVYGRDDYSEILLTSYYEPVLKGKRRPTKKHSYPLYKVPKDLVEISWKDYQEKIFEEEGLPKKNRVFGRLRKEKGKYPKITPFFSRKEIDHDGSLKKRNLELAYVDPIEGFFLQIQGSGTIEFPNKERVRLGYAAQNGYKYVSIGKHLKHIIPPEKMSLQKIEEHLRTLEENELMEFLSINPSYVFFRKLNGRPLTTFGTEVVDGRTLAIDYNLFPLGALAYLKFDSPVFENEEQNFTTEYSPTSRLVIATDSGGAIKGPDRADLFWGSGKNAARHAGLLNHKAYLYFLLPKSEFINNESCL